MSWRIRRGFETPIDNHTCCTSIVWPRLCGSGCKSSISLEIGSISPAYHDRGPCVYLHDNAYGAERRRGAPRPPKRVDEMIGSCDHVAQNIAYGVWNGNNSSNASRWDRVRVGHVCGCCQIKPD